MKLTDLIKELTAADIRLWLDKGQLKFSAPAGAMSAQRRALIVANKGEIVDFLANAKTVEITPAAKEKAPVLSYAQERLWSLEQLEGPSGLYNEGRALCIQGPLNTTALKQALALIIERHQVLRSAIINHEGRAQLHIQEHLPLPLQEADLTHLPNDRKTRREQVLELLSAESQRPFDLSKAPLLRFVLIKIDEQSHALGVFMHHLVCDGLSVRVFFSELSEAYASFCQQEAASLAPLPIQYSDFAHWQREHLDEVSVQRNLAYWRRHLKGLERVELGDHRPQDARLSGLPTTVSNKGQVHAFEIDGELTRRLDRLARDRGITRYVLMAAAYHVLLSACANTSDICFTTPVTERHYSELQSLVGLFVNTLAIRQSGDDAMAFNDFLAQTRGTVNDAFSHQQAPFERVVESLAQDYGGRRPVSQLMSAARFVYLEAMPQRLDFHDLQVEPFVVNRRLAKFDLMLTIERDTVEDGSLAQCRFEYKTDLFSAALIEDLSEAYQRLLDEVSQKPYRSLGELRALVAQCLQSKREEKRREHQDQRQQGLRAIRRRAVG
jgi:hypothetical protein